MNIDFVRINDYLENKDENVLVRGFVYSSIVGVLLILVIVLSSLKKRDVYYENILYYENNNIVLYVNYNELDNILNYCKLKVNNDEYSYYIKDINVIDLNNLKYQVFIGINRHNLRENVIYKYQILIKEESVLNYLIKVVRGDE